MKRRQMAVVLACLIAASCTRSGEAPPDTAQQAAPAKVEVDESVRADLSIQVEPAALIPLQGPVSANGQLQTNEDASWQVGALTDGKIISVPVRVGDRVREGQVLAVLHSHEVHDSRATYRQTVAELQRQNTLAENLKTVRDRTRRLFDLRAASREQLEAAETQYRSALTSVANAEAELQKAEFHLTDFLEVPVEGPPHGEHTPGGDSLTIKSPASGTVMQRNATAGSVVSMGDPVFAIADLSTLWMIAAVNEADMSRVRPGQPVEITVRAYPDRTFPGRVLKLGERLDAQTRTLQVRVLVPNAEGLLKPDMFATAQFAVQNSRTAIQIPESALQEIGGAPTVFVRQSDGAFHPRNVSVGARNAGKAEILSGLNPGDPVVVSGAFLLKSQLLKQSSE